MNRLLNRLCCALSGNHRWGPWYFSDVAACLQQRKCLRCSNAFEQRIMHDLGPWMYIASDSCEQKRRCVRDRAVLERRLEHSWGDWKLVYGTTCKRHRTCTRCQCKETQDDHDWTELERESYEERQHVCHGPHYDSGPCEDYFVTYAKIRKKCNQCENEEVETTQS